MTNSNNFVIIITVKRIKHLDKWEDTDMQINEKYSIAKVRGTNTINTNIIDDTMAVYDESNANYRFAHTIYNICKSSVSNDEKNRQLARIYRQMGIEGADAEKRMCADVKSTVSTTKTVKATDKAKTYSAEEKKKALENLIKFFSEFKFTPSFRFVNTLARVSKPLEYVKNYFMLQDFQYSLEIQDKIKSPEFKQILEIIHNDDVEPINNRFKLYFGEPGTGKTTQAQTEADYTIICASDMIPADLMQNFAFSDGKAEFQKSDLWLAMVEGKKIVLDEINMLPFESLRWLQGVLDGKKSFSYKGFNIDIKDGFEVIGTMNLNVNGQIISMPAPLVDRCSNICEFELDANALMSSIL